MTDHTPSPATDGLRARLTALADEMERGGYGTAHLRIRALLADPAPEAARETLARAWDEGFKQGGPMHDVNYDDPDAHRRNPYRARGLGGAS